jgi:hypothetical protein
MRPRAPAARVGSITSLLLHVDSITDASLQIDSTGDWLLRVAPIKTHARRLYDEKARENNHIAKITSAVKTSAEA